MGTMSEPMRPNLVTDQQRDRALDYLQQAYAKGVIDPEMFEDRMAQALTAATRGELNTSLRGLARVVSDDSTVMAPAPVARAQVPDNVQNVGAGLVHLLGVPTGFVGPAIVKAATPKGSRLWWEASRAMAWHLTALLVFMVTVVGSLVVDWELPIILAPLAWLVTTAIFSARAFNGQDSTGVLGRAMLFRPKLER